MNLESWSIDLDFFLKVLKVYIVGVNIELDRTSSNIIFWPSLEAIGGQCKL